jgi:prepilin-type processing-associated H-X9-DG protein
MAASVALFLCPSDGSSPPMDGSGPTNYAFCAGDGGNGGDATGANGTFILGEAESVATLTDGTSQTVAASEQLLGIAGPYSQASPTPVPSPWTRALARVAAGPLTDPACAVAGSGWLFNKGASWWDGNYLNALYNHYLPPNAGRPDCITYHNPGWKTARSLHPGGVNVLFGDGHVAFLKDTIQLGTWRALATRNGGEVVSASSF